MFCLLLSFRGMHVNIPFLAVRRSPERGKDRLHVCSGNGCSQDINVKLCEEQHGLVPGEANLSKTGQQEGLELFEDACLFVLLHLPHSGVLLLRS